MSTTNIFPNSNIETIADDVIVAFHYRLTLDDGEVIDESFGDEPLPYLHGAGGIVPGLEREMTGKKVGEKFKVSVKPEDGYGESSNMEPMEIPRSEFPDGMEVEVGMPIHAELEDGQLVIFHVIDLDDDSIYVTLDHPLAGETLNFEIEIMGLRPATKEELDHGHPHGLNGNEAHHH